MQDCRLSTVVVISFNVVNAGLQALSCGRD
jgi:hypothetical protein